MKTIHKAIAGLAILTLTASSGVPLTIKSPENNSTYNVEYLFEYESCKVYRFYDRANMFILPIAKAMLPALPAIQHKHESKIMCGLQIRSNQQTVV